MESSQPISSKVDKFKEEYYLDVQGAGTTVENVAELIAKIGASAIVLWFSFNELVEELHVYKKLRQDRKQENGPSTEL